MTNISTASMLLAGAALSVVSAAGVAALPETTCSQRARRTSKHIVPRAHSPLSRSNGCCAALAVLPPSSPVHISGSAAYLLGSAAATYLGLAAVFDRPGGSLALRPSCFEVKQSGVSGAGLGLFAALDMDEGTELGTYPGVVRTAATYMKKFRQYPDTCTYAWRFADSLAYIDPTDSVGQMQNNCKGGSNDVPGSAFLHENLLGGAGVPTFLARINEPAAKMGGKKRCNVITFEDVQRRTVAFSLGRDVIAGEELFLDYGPTYDRSGY